MKTKGLLCGVLAVIVVTALSAAVASAQTGTQSDDLVAPIDVTGSTPQQIDARFDTGNKITTFQPGQTNTNSSHQTADPKGKQPREKRERRNADDATPAEVAPSGGISTNPGSNAPANSTKPTGNVSDVIKELPRSGGTGVPALSIVGALLVAGGLLVRRVLR